MEKKKVLIIVNTHFNLMLAIQLRRTILKDAEVDLFLGREALYKVYKRGKLNAVFNNVFLVDDYNHKQTLRMFFFPKTFVKKTTQMNYIQYDAFFFWNLDWIIYNYFKASRSSKVEWHVYCDAVGGYLTDIPDGPPSYGNSIHGKVLSALDRIIWKWRPIDQIEHDYYLFNPEYFLVKPTCEHKRIPSIDINDRALIELLNEIWGYDFIPVKERVIYIDTGESAKVGDDSTYKSVVALAEMVGYDNIIIRPHPATRLDKYEFKDMHLMKSEYPFELFCLNGGLKNKLMVCNSSSAVLSLFVCFNMTPSVVTTISYIKYTHPSLTEKLHVFIRMISEKNSTLRYAHNDEELVELVKDFLTNNEQNGRE